MYIVVVSDDKRSNYYPCGISDVAKFMVKIFPMLYKIEKKIERDEKFMKRKKKRKRIVCETEKGEGQRKDKGGRR